VGQATVSDDIFPAPKNVPAGQAVHSVEPVSAVIWPAGQSRQEVEPEAGWYLEMRQERQTPSVMYLYLLAGQAMQPALVDAELTKLPELPKCPKLPKFPATWPWTVPALLVVWPAGQARQEVEAGVGWYVEAGHATHPAGAHSLKPAQLAPCPGQCAPE
jgi:hypothetical protein